MYTVCSYTCKIRHRFYFVQNRGRSVCSTSLICGQVLSNGFQDELSRSLDLKSRSHAFLCCSLDFISRAHGIFKKFPRFIMYFTD